MPADVNKLGLKREAYKGSPSTLCPGCGHDSISNKIIDVAHEVGLPMYNVIKLSGIGCSSKTPAYFLGSSHSFNSVHGRMPSVATGAMLANQDLVAIAVSGDGDTGSIGLGQYKHLIRRNVPMVYIIENNGVYGLTKGQFSATSDEGQKVKYYGLNELPSLDLCMEAITAGCTFVARSFSGDAEQMRTLLKAALSHRGTAVLDIVSPCVTFNNAADSNKSYPYGKANEQRLHDYDFIPVGYVQGRDEITVDPYADGEAISVEMHDGSFIRLKKLDHGHDPRKRNEALNVLEQARVENLFLTGLIYYEEPRPTLIDTLHITPTPLSHLQGDKLRPSAAKLDELMKSFA
ncbi:MAG: 2-oxoacid:ferredoxin oxidoreductase subunit beta [Chloroflexota bacterium]|nr:2-oxoacid:ferredoxin oxidoreductase subunit beta [Chloroflexota bacterium]